MRRIMLMVPLSAGLLAGAVAGIALATTPSGVTVTPLAPTGTFGEIHAKARIGHWEAKIKTKGMSDVYFTQVTIQPGGTLGWHSHPGLSFVIVKQGTATFYDGDDPSCTPHVFQAGQTAFEPEGHIHIVRNEGSVPLVNVVMQLVPTGAPRLISEPSPGNCPNL
jgi:quercetin dioxygenase-like cupin family protein